jgi:hypothetical protein
MSLSFKAIPHRIRSLALACGILGSFSCGDCVETPSVASMVPSSATVGSPEIVLVVNGDHFERTSTVEWNGSVRATTFVSGHQLQATITAEDLAAPAVVKVTVFSPPHSQPVMFGTTASGSATDSVKVDCAGGTSNVLNFAINP